MTTLTDKQLAEVGMTTDIILGFREAMRTKPSRPHDLVPMPDHFWEPRNHSRADDFRRGVDIAKRWHVMRKTTGIARREERNRDFRTIGAATPIDRDQTRLEAFRYLVEAVASVDGFVQPNPHLIRDIALTVCTDEVEWPDNAVRFYHADEPNGILSNTHQSSLRACGADWSSTEALYQAQKHPSFYNREKIRLAPDALTAKQISHELLPEVPVVVRNRWKSIKVTAMARVVVIRAQQDEAYRDFLLRTSILPIVEEAPQDRFWGAVRENGTLRGRNLLGRLHTHVRGLLIDDIIQPKERAFS